jgi:hypothetical protein
VGYAYPATRARPGSRAFARQDRVAMGVAVLSAATILAGAVWIVRRQAQSGDVFKITLVHQVESSVQKKLDTMNDLLRQYLPEVRKLADDGLDLNLRAFPRRAESG